MDEKKITQTSKRLSLVLRHQPELIGIELDERGWVSVESLLEAFSKHFYPIDLEHLQEAVANNTKKRFAFSEDAQKIRANQGHSVQVELGYTVIEPPEFLFHGTATRFLDSIGKTGLQKQKRHHVHLSSDEATARQVGSRHGSPAILKIKSGEMYRAGFVFFQSENGVWLTEAVPVAYIEF